LKRDFNRVSDRSATNAEKYALRRKLFGTDDVLPMWVADMDIETPPCIVEAVKRRAEHPVYGYEEMPESAFDAQIAWMQRRHAWKMERDWMRFSPSVVATINLAIQAYSEPGDGVVVQTPVYPPFFKSVETHGRRVVSNPLKRLESGGYTFDLEGLEAAIDARTKLLLLCSPHNPVGRVWNEDELRRLGEICVRHGIVIFADEVHSDLLFGGAKHLPVASLSEALRALTVTAIGPGKTFNVAGLSISTAVIPDPVLRERFDAAYEQIHFAQGTVFGHVGFEAAYRKGDVWLDALLHHLQENIDRLAALAARYSDRIRFVPPEGTYLVWLDCRGMGLSGKALRRFFIEEAGLGLSPGISFGREGEGYMRINIAVPVPIMDEALRRLGAALDRRGA
jgi:cysteine-S-conjugate beta-lyase